MDLLKNSGLALSMAVYRTCVTYLHTHCHLTSRKQRKDIYAINIVGDYIKLCQTNVEESSSYLHGLKSTCMENPYGRTVGWKREGKITERERL